MGFVDLKPIIQKIEFRNSANPKIEIDINIL